MPRTHHVALFDRGTRDKHNTIVLGTDLVIPLEADLDGDPEQDDEIRLRSLSGSYELVLHARDEAVKLHPEKPLLLYRFPELPRGSYELSVRVGDQWSVLVPEIKVSPDGVSIGGAKAETSLDDIFVGEPLDPIEEESADEVVEHAYRDQPEEATYEG
jgi:hypothetical protein